MIVLRNSEIIALSRTPDVFHMHIVHGDTPISKARALFPFTVVLFILMNIKLAATPGLEPETCAMSRIPLLCFQLWCLLPLLPCLSTALPTELCGFPLQVLDSTPRGNDRGDYFLQVRCVRQGKELYLKVSVTDVAEKVFLFCHNSN